MENLRVLGNNVLIRRDLYPDKRGSVYVATPTREHFSITGIVVSKGSRCKLDSYKPGDSVMYGVHYDRGIEGRYAIVKEDDLVAVNVEEYRPKP